jgi:pyruvate,water dikinase
MSTTTAVSRVFPSPYEIETPLGCEGWEELYPYYALFEESRRENDEARLWFWNSMHFPLPMPAFDVAMIDSPYQAVGAWQNRVFAVPPVMGIDYRAVNGYIYISANPVTDPAQIAERAEFFQRRAGYYYENWDELYGVWKTKMEKLIADLEALPRPELPRYESDEVFEGKRNTSFHSVLDGYSTLLRYADLMWQHHFEFLLLGYGAYMTFSELCRGALPDIPEQHIAQMVAGIDVILFKADTELRRLAKLALDSDVDGAFAPDRTPAEIDAELGRSESGRAWLEALEQVKDPWFHMGSADGLYHYFGSWFDDPTIPYASIGAHIAALQRGETVLRPTEQIHAERERLAERYGALLDEQTRPAFEELLALSRRVFPYVEEHKFYCDYWFLTRWLNRLREYGQLLVESGFLGEAEDMFQLSRHEVAQALDEACLTWASGGAAAGPAHWPPIVARRKEILAKLADWTPPPAIGTMPEEVVADPMSVMLWGITPQRLQQWAREQNSTAPEIRGSAASPGIVEGTARVVTSVAELASMQSGEILVCTITSPAWSAIFGRISATVTDIGGVMSHTGIVAREYGLPAVVGTGTATARIKTGMRLRVDGTEGLVTILDDVA